MAHNRTRSADRRPRRRAAPTSAPRLPGLRWVPVPLAMLAAALGWLLLGGAAGQHAAAAAAQAEHGYQAGGLSLSVDTMLWLSNDMSGQGPVKNPNPHGFKMDPSMMPGMQPVGENRLRVEVSVSNVTSANQRYSMGDFRVVTQGGKSYPADPTDGSTQATSSILRPGFGTTIDLYFDLPAAANKNLSVQWSHGGTAVDFPVSTNGKLPSPHIH
jgi:hypothetical protein